MVTAPAIIHAKYDHLDFDLQENPVALQLGGSDPAQLRHCAKLAEERGYHEINLNVGCPSDRVQNGMFGADVYKRQSVPNASELNRELSHRPNPQRKEAPIAAPALIRKIDWNIYLIPKISAKCLATASSLLNPISSSSGQASFKRESAFAIT